MALYQFYSISQLQKMELQTLNEIELGATDSLIIGFKKGGNIGDALLELIDLSRQLKDILYGDVDKN